jgi:hypothetical protein
MGNLEVLGTYNKKFLFVCRGVIPQENLPYAAQNIIAFVAMTPAREGRIDEYPYKRGGGAGYTGWFPLMESYLVMDAYTDLGKTELLISTCKPERLDPLAVATYLSKLIGPTEYRGSL